MRYVKQLDINGVEARQVACIELHGKPNAATEGAVGVLGMDVDSPKHEMYRCTSVNGSIYIWEALASDGGKAVLVTVDQTHDITSHSSIEIYEFVKAGYIVVAGRMDDPSFQYQYKTASVVNGVCRWVEFFYTAVNEDGVVTTEFLRVNADRTAEISYNEAAGGGSGEGSSLEARVKALEDQLYEPIAITSFATSPAYFEKGSTVNALTLNWKTNKTPIRAVVSTSTPSRVDEIVADDTSLYVDWISASVEKPVNFTLTVTDEKGKTALLAAIVTFYNGVYYGAAAEPTAYDSAFIRGLTKELRANKKPSFTANAGAGQYIYYCLPVSMRTCTFAVGGFTGGFSLVDTIAFTNASGYTENYYIYRSDNANLGNTSVTVS